MNPEPRAQQSETLTGRPILVTGAAGFIGRRLVDRLADECRAVTALIHRRGLPGRAGVTCVRGDLADPASLAAAVAGAGAVVHLAALKADEPRSHDVNVAGTASLIEACRAAGVRRLVYVSTQASPEARYGATKREGERLAEQSGLDVTILRPNLVYGADETGAFAKVVDSVRSMPIIPITGPARGRFWPVHVDDCCLAILRCLDRPATIGRSYVVAGPDGVTLPELLARVGAVIGRKPAFVHLPLWLSLAIARVCGWLSPERPLLTVSQILGCNQEAVEHDLAPMCEELGVAPRPLDAGLREVIRALG